MTLDLCPLIFSDPKAKTCLGCKVKKSQTREKGANATMMVCLAGIEEELKAAIKSPKEGEIILLELYKLKRITTYEDEDQKLNITVKRKASEILAAINEHKPKMDKAKQTQYSLDFGDVLFNLGRYGKAKSQFSRVIKLDSREKRAWNNIGVTLVRQGKAKEALLYYDKALALDSMYGSAWFNKGKVLFTLGKKKDALSCFQNATKYSPENKSAWNNLGVTLRHLKKYRESIKCYDQAIKIHSDYPWAWHNKGVALLELKKYKAARECFDKALHIDPNYEPAKESKRDVMRKVM
ncbi:MAG: tetratricopeptide repeat protein [Thermoplasmata archaeon]|nr:MAG: tetratricopeptide repeat protein [Thermoplasmata archaeon]